MIKNRLYILRIVLGSVYLVSGGEKLLAPYANFLYVVQGYDVLPWPALERLAAYVFPWVEFLLGGFLVLGLWCRPALWAVLACNLIFLGVVGQALLRRLEIAECGCFGDLVSLPLPAVFSLDIFLGAVTVFLLMQGQHISRLGLDQYFKNGFPSPPSRGPASRE